MLRRHRAAIALLAAALIGLVWLVHHVWDPDRGELVAHDPAAVSGDEPHYLMVIHSVLFERDLELGRDYHAVERGSLAAGRNFQRRRLDHHTILYEPASGDSARWVDVFAWREPVPCRRLDRGCSGFRRLDPDRFRRLDAVVERSAHPVGFPVLISAMIAPTAPGREDVEARAAIAIAIVAWLGLVATYLAARRAGLPGSGALAAVVILLASPYLAYARSYFAEPAIGAALAAALWAVLAGRFALAGALLTVAVWMKPVFVLVAFAWIATAWWRGDRRGAVVLAATSGLGTLALLVFNQWQAGTPLVSGVHGWKWITEFEQLTRTLIDRRYGLFWFAPWAIAGMLAVAPAIRRNETLVWIAVPLPLLLALFCLHLPLGSTCWGPRYWIPLLPWLAIATATLLTRRTRPLVIVAIVAAVVVAAAIAIAGALVYRDTWDRPPEHALGALLG